MRMKIQALASLAAIAASLCVAADSAKNEEDAAKNAADSAKKEEAAAKKPTKKVSALLVKANGIMSSAQDAYLDGDAKESVRLYRKAIEEIERIERENADRAGSQEFAPIKYRKMYCETEIDRILIEDASAKARTVTVTDTAELEKKREERHRETVSNNVPEKVHALASKNADGSAALPPEKPEDDGSEPSGTTVLNLPEELESAKDLLSVDKPEEAEKHILKVLKSLPNHREAHYLMAQAQIAKGRPDDADVVLQDVLEDRPDDEAALLLAAGAAFSQGLYPRSMDLLDRALKANPKRPAAYSNMAWVLLEIDPSNLSQPEMYYRRGVLLGGTRDRDLEKRLGIRQ